MVYPLKRGPKRKKPKNKKINAFPDTHINGLFGKIANELGRNNEKIIESILVELQEEGKIKSFSHSQPYSKEDIRGYDFVIFGSGDNTKTQIQVKSSIKGLQEFRQNCPYKKQNNNNHCGKCRIPVIVIKSRRSLESIKEGIQKILSGEKEIIIDDKGV